MKLKPTLGFNEYNDFNKWKERHLFEAKSQELPELDIVKEDIERAIAMLMGRFPFFGAFIYRFRILYVPATSEQIKTMATDGLNIYINPAFAASLTDAQTIFVLCHEILHNVMMHFSREKAKGVQDHERWNIAADYEINPMLVDEGLLTREQLKNDIHGLYEDKYLDMTAEEIYDLEERAKMPDLPKNLMDKIKKAMEDMEKENGSGGSGEGGSGGDSREVDDGGEGGQGGDPGGIGGTMTTEESAKIQKELGVPQELPTEETGKKLIERAIQEMDKTKGTGGGTGNEQGGSEAGKGSGLLRKAIQRFAKPQVNWKNELRRIIGKMISNNEEYFGKRKHLHKDEYFYGDRERTGALKDAVVAVDTSGSMTHDAIITILTEVQSVIKSKKIHNTEIVYFDDGISGYDKVKNPPKFDFSKTTHSGGTSFTEPMEHFAKRAKQHKLEIGIFCTDGYADLNAFPQNPNYKKKFIWLIIDNPEFKAPFGKIIHITLKKSK